jgi:hypothetical protein
VFTSIWGTPERESSVRIAAAHFTIRRHIDGTCEACPADESQVCVAFRCAIRRLCDHGGLPYLYRAL